MPIVGKPLCTSHSKLANEQAIRPLLRYLMTTEVGSRGGEADRAAEWEQSGPSRRGTTGQQVVLMIKDKLRRAKADL